MPEPRIHEYGELGNIHRRQAYEFGSVEGKYIYGKAVFVYWPMAKLGRLQ